MKEPKFTFDKTEFIVLDETSDRRMLLHVTKSNLSNIVFDPCVETGFLKQVPSEKIVLNMRTREDPLVYFKKKNAEYWEQYKLGLREFCKENRIPLYDNVAKEAAAENGQ